MSVAYLNENISAEKSEAKSITFFEYLYVFVLIIYAGRGSTFVESGSLSTNPIGVILPIILTGILALRWKIRFDKDFYFLILGLGIYFIAVSIKFGEIHPSFFITYFFKFFIVYTLIKALKFKLFRIYEYIMFLLGIVGLLMWIIQFFLGGDTLFYLLSRIPGINLFSYVTGNGVNIVIYSVQPTSYSIINYMIPRNCGFAQEPGSFAIYLCLALFINLFITSSEKGNKIRLWTLVIALISTQSTTGYIIFMVIVFFYILNNSLNKILLFFPLVIMVIIYVSTLPFMSEKIVGLINETENIDQLVIRTIGRVDAATPQRFTSFVILFKDFRNNPILGLGPDNKESWIYKIGAGISPISGIGNLMAQFGIVGLLFFVILSVRSSYFVSKYFNYRGRFLLFLIIISISISYLAILIPLVMSFWMFELFVPKENEPES